MTYERRRSHEGGYYLVRDKLLDARGSGIDRLTLINIYRAHQRIIYARKVFVSSVEKYNEIG